MLWAAMFLSECFLQYASPDPPHPSSSIPLPVRMNIDRGCLLLACLPGRRNYKGKSKGKPPSGELVRGEQRNKQGHLRPPPRTPCLDARPANHSTMCITCQFASSRQSQGLPGRCDYKSKSKRRPAPPPCPICPHSAAARPCLPLPPTHPPQPYDRMGLQLRTSVLRVDFQEPRGRSYWRVLALVLLSSARCVLESKSASLRAAAGVLLAEGERQAADAAARARSLHHTRKPKWGSHRQETT